jgi:isoquinoline 1-oxidoreductase beta subunit
MFITEFSDGAQAPRSTATSHLFNISRRGFMAGAGAGAFVMGLAMKGGPALGDATAGGLENVRGGDATPSLFISIAPDGTVKLTCHRSEMGQQVWTAIGQILADELEADWDRVEIVQAVCFPIYCC